MSERRDLTLGARSGLVAPGDESGFLGPMPDPFVAIGVCFGMALVLVALYGLFNASCLVLRWLKRLS